MSDLSMKTLEELNVLYQELQEKKRIVREELREVRRTIEARSAMDKVSARIDQMTESEQEAFAQVISIRGIQSSAKVGTIKQ